MGEFKSGLYYLCKKRPDLELIPVHIDNMNRILPRGEVLPVPMLSCISFGPPLWLEAGEAEGGVPRPRPRGRAAAEGDLAGREHLRPENLGLIGAVLVLLGAAETIVQVLGGRPESGIDAAILETFRLRVHAWWILFAILAAAFLLGHVDDGRAVRR